MSKHSGKSSARSSSKNRIVKSPRKNEQAKQTKDKVEKIVNRVFSYTSTLNFGEISTMEDIENISQTSSCVLNTIDDFEDLIKVNNITDLPFTNTKKVIKFLIKRYLNKQIYTWAGRTLLAINPYESIRFYTEECSPSRPSIDAVVSRAWFRLQHKIGKRNQALLISGESGSGKSYSACLAMKYIASRGNDASSESLLWQAWCSVPLLTAFGNAPTKYNNNSSRFGKLLQLQYREASIIGAFIQTYMLEKSRVTGPNCEEGNFHIFRQILDSLDVETLNGLYLDKKIIYKIAPKGKLRSSYTETVKALEILNIDLENILIILAVVLNLGNVEFELKEESYVVTNESLCFVKCASCLLKASTESLCNLLCTHQFCVKSKRNTIYTSPCGNIDSCVERRDCLMKFLYEKLFLWLVDSINGRIYLQQDTQLLGLVDVYGFEDFDKNSFEQLCINYANERLQQYFVKNYLAEQETELIAEGFDVGNINILDYTKRIWMIDGPVSIFGILNEECAVKRFNNDIFINTRLAESLKYCDHFIGSVNDLNTTFSIRHFAGVVKYDTKSMLHKNRDKVPDDMINFLKNCNNEFVGQLFDYNGTDENNLGNGTLIKKFKKSLDTLLVTLDKADVHYIKCLKSNPFQVAKFFDEEFFETQLVSNGVLDIMKLKFQNYSIRYNFQEFIGKFTCATFNLLQQVQHLKNEMHIGKKVIYLTEKGYLAFRIIKHLKESIAARKIQLYWLKYCNIRNSAAGKIQKFFRRIWFKRNSATTYEKFIDLSKKSSEISFFKRGDLQDIYKIPSYYKTANYLKTQRFDEHCEGAPLSLLLEKVFLKLRTKPFKRILFCGDRIVSFNKLAEIPVRLHTSKTCIKYSYLLPKSELPKGLLDIF